MTASIENIVQHLFQQPSLQSVSVDTLQQMTREHPSFAAARFLLLKKMQDTGHPDFTSQLHKTSVYFNNPLWLQLLLSSQGETAIAGKSVYDLPIEATDHQLDEKAHEAYEEEDTNVEHTTAESIIEEQTAAESPVIENTVEHVALAETETPAAEGQLMQEVLDRLRGQIHEADVHEQPPAAEASAKEYEAPAQDAVVPPELDLQEQDTPEDFTPAADADTIAHAGNMARVQTAEEATAEADDTDGAEATGDPDYPGHGTGTPDSAVKIIIETPMAKGDLLFEPYHTIDYFASQGIRLDKLEPVPQDKLGRQLKSFTEWIKSMKRLPQASIEQALGSNEESAVVAAASHSIQGKVVITEAMAEVFEKQGMYDKAVEVYRKLSLLNPAKSAYFADRIKVLKQ
jgi:hypothetical protein